MSVLRMAKLTDYTGMSRAQIYVLMKAGKFVDPIRLGERAVGWRQEEVDAWIASRPLARAS